MAKPLTYPQRVVLNLLVQYGASDHVTEEMLGFPIVSSDLDYPPVRRLARRGMIEVSATRDGFRMFRITRAGAAALARR